MSHELTVMKRNQDNAVKYISISIQVTFEHGGQCASLAQSLTGRSDIMFIVQSWRWWEEATRTILVVGCPWLGLCLVHN